MEVVDSSSLEVSEFSGVSMAGISGWISASDNDLEDEAKVDSVDDIFEQPDMYEVVTNMSLY